MHIKSTSDNTKQCSNQHAYIKGISVESVLLKVVPALEKSLQDREYTSFGHRRGFQSNQIRLYKKALELLGVEQLTITCYKDAGK